MKADAPKRGEIYWVNLDPTQGSEIRKKRPCVVIGVDPINAARRTIVVVPLSTSAKPRPPLVIALPSAGKESSAVCDQIRAIDKSRLMDVHGALSGKDLSNLEEGLRVVLGL